MAVHGHLAWLALVLLIHPLVSLKRRTGLPWGTRISAYLAASLLSVPFGLGLFLYPTYRASVKPGLWERSPQTVFRFESKEHLAFFAVVLATSGALVLHRSGGVASGRRLAWWLLASALGCGVVAGSLGVAVRVGAHAPF